MCQLCKVFISWLRKQPNCSYKDGTPRYLKKVWRNTYQHEMKLFWKKLEGFDIKVGIPRRLDSNRYKQESVRSWKHAFYCYLFVRSGIYSAICSDRDDRSMLRPIAENIFLLHITLSWFFWVLNLYVTLLQNIFSTFCSKVTLITDKDTLH